MTRNHTVLQCNSVKYLRKFQHMTFFNMHAIPFPEGALRPLRNWERVRGLVGEPGEPGESPPVS